MKNKSLLFILTLLLITLLSIISQNSNTEIIGLIEKIQYNQNQIKIYLNNHTTQIIVFTTQNINLKKSDKIKIIGQISTYKNTKQLIADKIILLK